MVWTVQKGQGSRQRKRGVEESETPLALGELEHAQSPTGLTLGYRFSDPCKTLGSKCARRFHSTFEEAHTCPRQTSSGLADAGATPQPPQSLPLDLPRPCASPQRCTGTSSRAKIRPPVPLSSIPALPNQASVPPAPLWISSPAWHCGSFCAISLKSVVYLTRDIQLLGTGQPIWQDSEGRKKG